LEDFLGGGDTGKVAQAEVDIADLSARIKAVIEVSPLYFAELAEKFVAEGFQPVARALGELHVAGELWQDDVGRYCLTGSEFAATPPEK
jgi:2,5-furandicarboxylate decarboxylase 1